MIQQLHLGSVLVLLNDAVVKYSDKINFILRSTIAEDQGQESEAAVTSHPQSGSREQGMAACRGPAHSLQLTQSRIYLETIVPATIEMSFPTSVN